MSFDEHLVITDIDVSHVVVLFLVGQDVGNNLDTIGFNVLH